jgi:hypothetical protein
LNSGGANVRTIDKHFVRANNRSPASVPGTVPGFPPRKKRAQKQPGASILSLNEAISQVKVITGGFDYAAAAIDAFHASIGAH